MKVKITSDGKPRTTRVTNAQTGEQIPGVKSVTWHSGLPNDLPRVDVQMILAGVEVVGDLESLDIVTNRGERRRFILPAGTREVDVTEIGDEFTRTAVVEG